MTMAKAAAHCAVSKAVKVKWRKRVRTMVLREIDARASATCAASEPGVRDRRVAFGKAARVGDQPGREEDGEVRGGGGEPALGEPVIEAGGEFDGRGGGEKDASEGDDVVGGDEERGGGGETGEGGDGRDDQQVFAPGDGESEDGEGEEDEGGGPRREGVEAEGRFPEQRREDEHGGEGVERGFEAARRAGCGGQTSQKMA